MKQKQKNILVGIIIIALVVGALAYNQGWRPFAIGLDSQSFTPIFCNDYSFTCCNEKRDSINNFDFGRLNYLKCPSFASKCVVVDSTFDTGVKGIDSGTQNCGVYSPWIGLDYFKCDDGQRYKSFPLTIKPYQYIYGGGFSGVIEVYKERLDFCGRSGCTVGVPVLGADQCKFNPETGKIYTTVGQMINAFSWTVPRDQCVLAFQSGDRHICGYKEETCMEDNDCGGHTYGRFECSGRTLQEYGCNPFGQVQTLQKDRLPSDSNWGQDSSESLFGKRCEIKSAIQVQCCGDTDCGTNYFCDRNTWTCQREVQCDVDTDCGVSIRCDWVSKSLKKPVCNFGTCDFDETSVDCCSDVNCQSGFFCNTERKCEERVATCTTCPYECCEDECTIKGGYFDRLCSEEKPFCVDNACGTEDIPDEVCKDCDTYALNRLIGWVWKDKACKPKLLQNTVFCAISFIKLFLVPVILIFATLFGFNFFQENKSLRINNKGVAFLVSLVLAGLLAVLVFFSFWTGIIVSIIYLGIVILIRLFVPKSFRKKLK